MPIRLPQCAGEPYRPSNGTEGMMFEEQFCMKCSKEETCGIMGLTMLYDIDEPEYPKDWVFDKDGRPTCTAFTANRESEAGK